MLAFFEIREPSLKATRAEYSMVHPQNHVRNEQGGYPHPFMTGIVPSPLSTRVVDVAHFSQTLGPPTKGWNLLSFSDLTIAPADWSEKVSKLWLVQTPQQCFKSETQLRERDFSRPRRWPGGPLLFSFQPQQPRRVGSFMFLPSSCTVLRPGALLGR